MLEALRRRQTLASFDFQWGELAEGDAMLSDPWFRENVDRILSDEMLCVAPGWFRGRTVLDAGCGMGRWTLGFLRLGCRVLAVDASARALTRVRTEMGKWAPSALAEGRLETRQVDLLHLPGDLRARRFDVVYSFGVLHHTGDTRRALEGLVPLLDPAGLLFLYLYGRRSLTPMMRAALMVLRTATFPLPFRLKSRVLAALLPARDPHQLFDTYSPAINDTYDHETVEAWLAELGLPDVVRTIRYSELYLRARREGAPALPALPLPERPYWFERYRRRPLRKGTAPE